jgi:DNA-binding PadR family transcriptional regulator
MPSTLGYALLGLLAREPLSGYDLAQQMKDPVAFFWHAQHSQIYPELARLELDGLVQFEVVAQYDRPDKKVYAPTEAGRAALRSWVESPTGVPPARDELVLKAYTLWLANPARTAQLFRDQAATHRAQLARYRQIERRLKREHRAVLEDPSSTTWAAYATLRRGIGFEREQAGWCAWVAAQLESPRPSSVTVEA